MRRSISDIMRLRGFILLLMVLLCCLSTMGTFAMNGKPHLGAFAHIARGTHVTKWKKKSAPTDADCRAQQQQPCYTPQEMQNAYGLASILNSGYTGKGQTIVIIDSFGSPTALADLQQFDADYGLRNPPFLHILSPLGKTSFDPNNSDQVGWAQETSLDIQWAHAMAPDAGIVVLTSPVSETQGLQGMPQFLKLQQYALSHHLGNILSLSWGTTEETLFSSQGKGILNAFNTFYQQAAMANVSVLASAGDSGVLNPDIAGNNYPYPTVNFPASSPWVTAVGGTSLHADTEGNYQYETVWNDGLGNATGGGYSMYFSEPLYQRQNFSPSNLVAAHGRRGIPDVAYNGDPLTGIPVYLGFMSNPGYYLFGGTSAGAPQWAGIVADASQQAGHPIGFLNNKLYNIAHNPQLYYSAFHDITSGNNSQDGLEGYSAGPGWDATTGWGSPFASGLIPLLLQK